MSIDWFLDCLEFHEKFAPERIGTTPKAPYERVDLLLRLISEEFDELYVAMHEGDIPGAADAMADMIYVVLGCAVSCGIDLRPVFEAVHASNMTKIGGSKRADGKLLKPENFVPPDIAGILSRQGPLQPEGMEAS